MEQIIKQNMFSRTLFNESKLGAYYTDPVHAAKIGRLFRLQGECCVLEPSFGNAEALKAFLSQCERADEGGRGEMTNRFSPSTRMPPIVLNSHSHTAPLE